MSDEESVVSLEYLRQRALRACVTMAKWSAFILSNLFNRFGFFLLGIVNKHSHDQLSVTG